MTTTTAGRRFLAEHPNRIEGYGYQKVSDTRCPRTLVRKRCRGIECWCSCHLNDHAATYTRHGERVVLWEPYDAHPEELVRLFAAADADGLRVSLSGMSPWNPGSTFGIEFRADER